MILTKYEQEQVYSFTYLGLLRMRSSNNIYRRSYLKPIIIPCFTSICLVGCSNGIVRVFMFATCFQEASTSLLFASFQNLIITRENADFVS